MRKKAILSFFTMGGNAEKPPFIFDIMLNGEGIGDLDFNSVSEMLDFIRYDWAGEVDWNGFDPAILTK